MFSLYAQRFPDRRPDRPRTGFSLIELLTVIAVVAVLASLVVAGLSKIKVTAMKSEATANLRQIGTAVLAFANEHNGTLPGPSSLGLVPYYYNPYPRDRSMQAAIAPYLGISPDSVPRQGRDHVFVPQLVCPAASKLVDDPDHPPPYYVQNFTLPIPRGRIFGAQAWGESDAVDGWMLSRIEQLGQSGKIWLLTNLDQALPSDWSGIGTGSISSSGWFSRLPEAPVWGDGRLRLYLDGHVDFVPRATEP